MSGDGLRIHQSGCVLVLTLDRPRAANALNPGIRDGFCAALGAAADDRSVGAVVLTGGGSRVFSGGVDLKNPDGLEPGQLAEQRSAIVFDMLSAILRFEKPLTCAVNGVASGAGCFLALLCDRVFVSDDACFVLSEIDVGLPTLVGLAILSDLDGTALSADLVLSGRRMPAEEAARRGLATHVAAGELMECAGSAAQDLAGKPAVAVALNKRWLNTRRRRAIDQAFAETRAQRQTVLQAGASAQGSPGARATGHGLTGTQGR